MIPERNPYERPSFRGPEYDGLNADEAFDLAKQLRIAARNKRIGMKLGTARVRHGRAIACWGVIGSIAIICAGLGLLMWTVHLWH